MAVGAAPARRQARLLGMVGGLGPTATVFYYRLIVSRCRRLCGKGPRLLVYSIPLEEMCRAARSMDRGAMAELVMEALGALARGGAGVAFVSANTPHVAWDLFEPRARGLGLELVSIVEAAVAAVEELGAWRVGVMATHVVNDTGLYRRALEERGVEVLEPPPAMQGKLDEAISSAFAPGRVREEDLALLVQVARDLVERGAEAILLACTDLSPYMRLVADAARRPVVDAAREQVARALELATVPLSEEGPG